MTHKVVRAVGLWSDSGMHVFKKSHWGEVYMVPMSMEWVVMELRGTGRLRVFFGLFTWTVITLRMTARVGEDRSTVVQVQLL